MNLRVGGDIDMGLGLCRGGVESNDVIAGRFPTGIDRIFPDSSHDYTGSVALSIGPYPRDNIDNN